MSYALRTQPATHDSSLTRTTFRALRRLISVLLATAVVTLTLAFTALAALPSFDARAMAVTSGSMEPGIAVGSLLVVKSIEPETISVGDVITYSGYTTDKLTTHRVLAVSRVKGVLHFQTQGDANDTPDPDLAPAAGVVGLAVLDVPYAGRALNMLSHPHTRLIVLGVPAGWIAIKQVLRLRALLIYRGRHRRQARADARLAPAGLVVVLALTFAGSIHTTRAILSDFGSVTGNDFATGSWASNSP